MAKSEDAKMLDNAIRAASARATSALAEDDQTTFTDASADLHELRMMRFSLNETDA